MAYRLRERKSERCAIGGVSHLLPSSPPSCSFQEQNP